MLEYSLYCDRIQYCMESHPRCSAELSGLWICLGRMLGIVGAMIEGLLGRWEMVLHTVLEVVWESCLDGCLFSCVFS